LTTGYCGDDVLNSQSRAEMIQSHLSLWGVTRYYAGLWITTEGRSLYPQKLKDPSAQRLRVEFEMYGLTATIAELPVDALAPRRVVIARPGIPTRDWERPVNRYFIGQAAKVSRSSDRQRACSAERETLGIVMVKPTACPAGGTWMEEVLAGNGKSVVVYPVHLDRMVLKAAG
jgi:hypothetical protein